GAESSDRERLRLTAGEDRRPVRAGSDSNLDPDRPDLVRATTVGTLLVHCNAAADDVLLELVEGELRVRARVGVALGGLLRGERVEHFLLDLLGRVLALELVLHLRGGLEGGTEAVGDLLEQVLVDLRDLDLLLLLARDLLQLALRLAELADLGVRDRSEERRVGKECRAGR